MTRTTVYRYFPTQESLLLEVSVTVGVDDVEALLARPRDGAPQERMLEVIEKLNRHIADNEALYRAALRHYNDQWLAAERAGEGHDQPFREGRRLHWIETVLAPLRDTMADDDRRRLEAALCLVMGGEAFTVLRDVCKLDADEAIAVANWAARVLLDAVIERPS